MDLSKALITGGNGMVGSNIHFGYKPTSSEMNICEPSSIEEYISKLDPISCIVHLAATNLRESETYPKKAIDANINGTSHLLSMAKKRNIPFVLISTGAVFSTDKHIHFTEDSVTCPNSMYGYTKSASEKIALLYEKTILIRTGWLFGGNQKNHYKFVEQVIQHFMTKTDIKASTDFIGSPTYVKDFITSMTSLIKNSSFGIHHLVNQGYATGYEIAIEISSILKTDSTLIQGCKHENLPNAGPLRSHSEVLTSINTSNQMRSWKESLKEYVLEYHSKKMNPCKRWENRESCRLCNGYNLQVFLNLEPTPQANHFVMKPTPQEVIPLDIGLCTDCNHVQLIQKVDPAFQYSNYLYVSSTSNKMTDHLKNTVLDLTKDLGLEKHDFILEIGANDGVCIKQLMEDGFTNVVGVDPAENINKRHKLPILCDFFGSKMVPRLKEYGPCKLIYAFHCCAHIEEIQDVFSAISQLLAPDGVFMMEVGYFYEVFKNNCFDTIYHEHIDYHTCNAMQQFSKNHGLFLYDVKVNSIQGGSIQFYFSKKTIPVCDSVIETIQKERAMNLFHFPTLLKWKTNILKCGNDIHAILTCFKEMNKKVVGYGASAKSTTFLYQYKLTNQLVHSIIDDNLYKQNYYSPGLHIPIKSIDTLNLDRPDYILILSWNFTDEIIKKLQPYRESGLRIIIPFPDIRIF
jgi:dTDP-4-dehydrorhamnose reductase